MSGPTALEGRLLENHLAFTAKHRAVVTREPHIVRWRSSSDEFSCVLLHSARGVAFLAATDRSVRTFPWTREGEALDRSGFKRTGCLRYMLWRPQSLSPPEAEDRGLEIRIARTTPELSRFTDVQTESFRAPDEPREEIHTFLDQSNSRNLGETGQTFFVGHYRGTPIAVTLLLINDGVAGIYAVGTLPQYRGRGFSRLMLHRAIADALDRGCDTVALQVHQGSLAERVYARLEFAVAFDCTLWTRKTRVD